MTLRRNNLVFFLPNNFLGFIIRKKDNENNILQKKFEDLKLKKVYYFLYIKNIRTFEIIFCKLVVFLENNILTLQVS